VPDDTSARILICIDADVASSPGLPLSRETRKYTDRHLIGIIHHLMPLRYLKNAP
jgi:hypothetical protein